MTLTIEIYPPTVKPKTRAMIMILIKETGGWHHGYANKNGKLLIPHRSGTALAWHYCLTIEELNHAVQESYGSAAIEKPSLPQPSIYQKSSDHWGTWPTGRKGTRRAHCIPNPHVASPPTQSVETQESPLA